MTSVVEPETSATAGINNMASGFAKICRTCASCTDCLMPIFHGEGLLNNLPEKIQRHLPIQVSERDRLPQQLCRPCADTLLAWHELVKCCSQADAALRTRLQRLQQLRPEENVPTTSTAATEEVEVKEKNVKWEIDFRKYLESILVNYIDVTSQNMRQAGAAAPAANNIIYVCQKCERYSPFHTVGSLADHLQLCHAGEIRDEAAVTHFVTEHLILVETLDESLPVEPAQRAAADGAEDVSLAPVRTRRRKETVEALDRLCCPFCQKIFSAPKRLIVHLNVHPEVSVQRGYECRCCALTCRDMASFVRHLQAVHVAVDLERSQRVCRSCGHICDGEEELREHVKTSHATRPNRAKDENPKSVKSRSKLKYTPVECPVCGRSVSNKYNLSAHMRQHGRPGARLACAECGRSYRSRGSLKWHTETVHRGVLRYICEECGEAFPSKMYRDVHSRIHSGETPFQCESCRRSFRSKNSLVNHMKSHLDIRNYPCTRCDKRFQKSTHLRYHLESHERKESKKREAVRAKTTQGQVPTVPSSVNSQAKN